jgi:hypothetical protein
VPVVFSDTTGVAAISCYISMSCSSIRQVGELLPVGARTSGSQALIECSQLTQEGPLLRGGTGRLRPFRKGASGSQSLTI